MKKRIFYLDLLRVWAILSVVLLHCIMPILTRGDLYSRTSWYISLVLNEICRAGVPLFLMISGALLLGDARSAEIGTFYKKRLPRLLVPLFVWHTLYYILHAVFRDGGWGVRSYFSSLFGSGSAYHMWFVYALLGIYLITPFLKRITDGCTIGQLALLLAIVSFPGAIRPLWNMTADASVYLFDPLMEPYLAYFLLGYLLSRIRLAGWMLPVSLLFAAGGLSLGIFGNLSVCTPETMELPFNGGYMLNHLLLAGAIFLLARLLTENIRIYKTAVAACARLSDTSFGVYWIHVLLLGAARELLSLHVGPLVQGVLYFAAVTVSAWALMIPLSYVKPLKKWIM